MLNKIQIGYAFEILLQKLSDCVVVLQTFLCV